MSRRQLPDEQDAQSDGHEYDQSQESTGAAGSDETPHSPDRQEPAIQNGPGDAANNVALKCQFEEAAGFLVNGGIDREIADRALNATSDKAGNMEGWLEEAQIWLTTLDDAETEILQMREAMAASLAEIERHQEVKLQELSVQNLFHRFNGTELMKALCSCSCGSLLESASLKPVLVDLLEYEYRCTNFWYKGAGTTRWFESVAQECLPLLRDLQRQAADADMNGVCSTSTFTSNDQLSSADPHRLKRARTSANGSKAAAAASGLDALMCLCQKKVEQLQKEVCLKPPTDGGPPYMFRSQELDVEQGGHDDRDDVVLVVDCQQKPKEQQLVDDL